MPPPPVPSAPPQSPPPASVTDCQAITKAVRAAAPAEALAEYNLRGWYQAVLDYATKARDPAPVYDFWWAVEGHRQVVGRGFYLDLWDLHKLTGPGGAAFDEQDKELLRCYICQINSDFVPILAPTGDIAFAFAWQRRIADLAAAAATPDARRFLYSVLNLYADLYPTTVDKEGRAELERQLRAADAAKGCQVLPDAPLLRPRAALAGPPDAPDRTALVHVLAFTYKSLEHFGVKPLQAVVEDLVARLGGSADERRGRVETLLRLFKFWAADSPLVLDLLRDKCEYKFHAPPPARPVELPAYHGTDNFVCLVGEREVGKTGFMFASEAASQLPAAGAVVPKLTIHHVSQDATKVDDVRTWWLTGKLSKTENQTLYARTAVKGLCRFTFYAIPGEELYTPDRLGPSPWLQNHFKKRKPCALLMMFAPRTAGENVNRYVRLVELLEQHLGTFDPRYRDLPVYFVLNKSDLLLGGDSATGSASRRSGSRPV